MPQNYLGIHGVVGLVVAVGDHGKILHCQGDRYAPTQVESHTTANLYAVSVVSERCAYAVGDHGAVLHWNGDRWNTVMMGAKEDELFAVWSCPGGVTLIGGHHILLAQPPHATAADTLLHTTSFVIGIWGSGPRDIWFLCRRRLVYHWNGTACTAHQLPGEQDDEYCAIGGSGPNDLVWVVGVGGAMVFGDGETWETLDSGTDATLLGVCAAGSDDVWVTTNSGQLRHWDGRGWD